MTAFPWDESRSSAGLEFRAGLGVTCPLTLPWWPVPVSLEVRACWAVEFACAYHPEADGVRSWAWLEVRDHAEDGCEVRDRVEDGWLPFMPGRAWSIRGDRYGVWALICQTDPGVRERMYVVERGLVRLRSWEREVRAHWWPEGNQEEIAQPVGVRRFLTIFRGECPSCDGPLIDVFGSDGWRCYWCDRGRRPPYYHQHTTLRQAPQPTVQERWCRAEDGSWFIAADTGAA